jgi:hypothetical protein
MANNFEIIVANVNRWLAKTLFPLLLVTCCVCSSSHHVAAVQFQYQSSPDQLTVTNSAAENVTSPAAAAAGPSHMYNFPDAAANPNSYGGQPHGSNSKAYSYRQYCSCASPEPVSSTPSKPYRSTTVAASVDDMASQNVALAASQFASDGNPENGYYGGFNGNNQGEGRGIGQCRRLRTVQPGAQCGPYVGICPPVSQPSITYINILLK